MVAGMSSTDVKELVEKLFGISWDRVLAGFVYSLASGWFWWAVLTSTRPRYPLDGLARLLETLAITPPAWISGTASWLSHPERAGFVLVLGVGAGLAATIYARTQSTGSEAACVILSLTAIQGGGPTTGVVATLVTVVIAAGVSALLALGQDRSEKPDGDRPFEGLLGHHTGFATVTAALTTLFPFVLVPLAPLAPVAIAIRCLRADREIDEAAALSFSALHRLQTGSAADQRAAAQTLILAGALLTNPHDNRACQDAAGSLRNLFTGPTGADPGRLRPRL